MTEEGSGTGEIKMSLYRFGSIRKVSNCIFVWDVDDLIDILQDQFECFSETFEYASAEWYLKFKRSGSAPDFLMEFHLSVMCPERSITQSYQLYIKDIEGKCCWSSPVLATEFNIDNRYDTNQVFICELKNYRSGIAPEGRLSLHLLFDPPANELPTQQEDVAVDTVNPPMSRKRIEVRTQTCSKMICGQGCSLNTVGVEKLLQDFKDLMIRDDCDVTLNVRGRTFKAHKPILKCRSPVFDRMFQNEMIEKNSGVVDIMDCEPDVLPDFLLYLYTGKLENVDVQSAVHLHYICRKYGVDELASFCVKYMIDNLTVENFCKFVNLGLRHCELELIESATLFLSENVKETVVKDEWMEFFLESPKEAHRLLNKAMDKNKALEKSELPRK